MKTLTLLSAVNDALMVEMKNDDSIIVYGEDVGVEGGVFRATVDLQKTYGEARCFDSPLAESGIVGTAIGMAVNRMVKTRILEKNLLLLFILRYPQHFLATARHNRHLYS